LGTSEDNYITLVCEQGETPELSGDIRSLPATYTVKGSPGSEKLLELHLYTLKHYELFDSLSEIWEQGKYDKDKLALRDSLDSIARGVYQAQEEYVKQFVENNMESLTAILALYQVFGRIPVLDEFEYLDLYDQTAQSLKLKYPTNQHVNELSARVSKNKALQKEKEEITKRLLPGNPVPELSLPDREGSPVSVADYKGYALLLYFWSSTDPKCRKMNPELLTLQKKYEAKGFSLFSISLDNNPDIWEKAITLDKLPGVHVIDQRGWSSPVINMFNIESIPHTILIDKEGIIIGNNLNFEEINTRLHETVSANKNP